MGNESQNMIEKMDSLLNSLAELHRETGNLIKYRLPLMETLIADARAMMFEARDAELAARLHPDVVAMTFDVLLAPEGAYLRFPHRQEAPSDAPPFTSPGDGFQPSTVSDLAKIIRAHVVVHDRNPRQGFRSRAFWALQAGRNNIVEVVPVSEEPEDGMHLDSGEMDAFDEMFAPPAPDPDDSGDFNALIDATLAEMKLLASTGRDLPLDAVTELFPGAESALSNDFDALSNAFGFMLRGEEPSAELIKILDSAEKVLRQNAEQSPDSFRQAENMFSIIMGVFGGDSKGLPIAESFKGTKESGLSEKGLSGLFKMVTSILPKIAPTEPEPRPRRPIVRKK